MPEHGPEIIHNLDDSSPESQSNPESLTDEQMAEAEARRASLAVIAKFIGKDFNIPVKLSEPGGGWFWDFEKNEISADPVDIVRQPLDYSQFVIAHEGSHRRISRFDHETEDLWRTEPGFSFLANAIEDPRVNNFLAEAYPRMRELMHFAYESDLEMEERAKQKADSELGFRPRFEQAGFEYIHQWIRDEKGEDLVLPEDLPEDVRQVLEATLEVARDAWWTYPSRTQADSGEGLIKQYASDSQKIIREQIWPEFKKLIDLDRQDAMVEQALSDMAAGEGAGDSGTEPSRLPPELADKLSNEEQAELEKALENAASKPPGEGHGELPSKLIPLGDLSDGLRQKIGDYIDGLPENEKQHLGELADKMLDDYSQDLAERLGGKLSEDPMKTEASTSSDTGESPLAGEDSPKPIPSPESPSRTIDTSDIKRTLEALKSDSNIYEQERRELLPIIDRLEQDLREIFVARRSHQYQSGFRSGRRIDIKRRIQEKAQGVSAVQSEAWQRRELPSEKDYAISLLVDLSGSMRGEKIDETFKAVVVLAEVLNRLSINCEILGFTDRIYEYQKYDEAFGVETRQTISAMPPVTSSEPAQYNDDGWALEQASSRLARRRESEKFLIVLSDGLPVPSGGHSGPEYDLNKVVSGILREADQKLIGLGIGPGTSHVERYYPNAIADVSAQEMSETLAELLRQVIVDYQSF